MTSVDPKLASPDITTTPPASTDTLQPTDSTLSGTQQSLDTTKHDYSTLSQTEQVSNLSVQPSQPNTLEIVKNLDANVATLDEDSATAQTQDISVIPIPTDSSEKQIEHTPIPDPIQTPKEEVSQTLNNSNVGQEDRIDIFTSGMDDDQEFPNTDGLNSKSKETPLEGNTAFDKSNTTQSLELSDKENKHDEKSRATSLSITGSGIRDELSGTSKHKEHHTHKDLREILTKNSVATNKNRDYESRRSRKASKSGIEKLSLPQDRESNQRRRRMYQEIKKTLTASTSSGFGHHEMDPEREWENKKREREIQRIEVERARRELDSRRRQDSLSSQRNTNGLKKSSVSSYLPDSRSIGSLSIEGMDLRDIPIPPVVSPPPSDAPVSRLVRVQNLVRPFTQTQLKSMLELYGPLIVTPDTNHQFFWTDKNKTQCCCIYFSIESCEKARTALHGARWPSINPKTLNLTFLSIGQFNELTGLGVDNEILDKYKREIVKTEPLPLVEKPKEQENLKERRERVKERLKEKELRDREKTREKESREVREKRKSKSTREPPAKRPTTSTSDDKKHLSSSKDHHSSQKDHHISQKDHSSQRDLSSTSKDQRSSQKDSIHTAKKDQTTTKDLQTSKDHTSTKEHVTSSKVHQSSSKDHHPISKGQTASKEYHSSKDHPSSSKDHPSSSKDLQLSSKDHLSSSKDHSNQKDQYNTPKLKEKSKTEPVKVETKSKSESAAKPLKQIKLDKPEVTEKKVATKRPTSSRASPPPEAKKQRESKAALDSDAESETYQSSGQAALLDTLFRKTVAEPCIYWLPLTDKQIKLKIARQKMRDKRHSPPEPDRRVKRKYSRSPRRNKRK